MRLLPGRLLLFFLLEFVLDAQHLAGAVVDLLGRVLGVLQLRQAVLDLGQLFLDLRVEVVDLLAGHLEGLLVELGLVLRERHAPGPSYLMPNRFKSFWMDMLALGSVASAGEGAA